MHGRRILVGLLNNPVVPSIVRHAPDLVEYIDVIPDRLWYDFEHGVPGEKRFRRTVGAIEELKECAEGRVLGGHGIGLSLPSAIPIDMAMVAEVASLAHELNFQWFSEHLSMFLVAHGSVPNSQAGLGLPVAYDEETFLIVKNKLDLLKRALGCDIILENGAVFTPVPDTEMSETQFRIASIRNSAAARCSICTTFMSATRTEFCRRSTISKSSIPIVCRKSILPVAMIGRLLYRFPFATDAARSLGLGLPVRPALPEFAGDRIRISRVVF